MLSYCLYDFSSDSIIIIFLKTVIKTPKRRMRSYFGNQSKDLFKTCAKLVQSKVKSIYKKKMEMRKLDIERPKDQ